MKMRFSEKQSMCHVLKNSHRLDKRAFNRQFRRKVGRLKKVFGSKVLGLVAAVDGRHFGLYSMIVFSPIYRQTQPCPGPFFLQYANFSGHKTLFFVSGIRSSSLRFSLKIGNKPAQVFFCSINKAVYNIFYSPSWSH